MRSGYDIGRDGAWVTATRLGAAICKQNHGRSRRNCCDIEFNRGGGDTGVQATIKKLSRSLAALFVLLLSFSPAQLQ